MEYDIDYIKELSKDGYSKKEIGEKLGCHEETIRRICKKYNIKTYGCSKLKTLKNQKSGMILFVKIHKKDNYRHYIWECKCSCGNTVYLRSKDFGKVVDCGCKSNPIKNIKRDICSDEFDKSEHCKLSDQRIYKIYRGMKTRCNPQKTNINNWEDYGGRGIKVCEEWLDKKHGFSNFYSWSIENGYADDLTIDRIDVNGNYEPINCRWATRKEQSRNTRTNRLIEYNGEVKCLAEWSEIFHIPQDTLKARIDKYNWSIEKALKTPTKKDGEDNE